MITVQIELIDEDDIIGQYRMAGIPGVGEIIHLPAERKTLKVETVIHMVETNFHSVTIKVSEEI